MTLQAAAAFAIAAHPFDTDFNDQVGTHHLSQVGGTVSLTAGKYDNAATFAAGALTRGIVIPGISLIRCWIKPSSSQSGVIATQGVAGLGTLAQFNLLWQSFGALTFSLTTSSGGMNTFVFCDPDVWSLVHAWIDLNVVGTVSVGLDVNAGATGGPSILSNLQAPPTFNSPFDLGGQESSGVITQQYLGQIDDLVLLGGGRLLDAAERLEDFNNGPFATWNPPPPLYRRQVISINRQRKVVDIES